jgi:ssDNA-binding protein
MSDKDQFIFITGARVSFPHLFKKPIINGDEGKCGAKLMLETDADAVKPIKTNVSDLIKSKLKIKKLPASKLCLRDGDEEGRPEYEGLLVLSANCKGKPIVVDSTGRGVISDEADSDIYAGCFVNAKIRLWAQDNTYGKRVNAELVSIQFAAHGEPLDDSFVSVDDAVDGFGSTEGGSSDNDNSDDDDPKDFLAA